MKILLMDKNLLLISKIKSSLRDYEVRIGNEHQGEDLVLVNLEQFPPAMIKKIKESGAKVIAYCGHKRSDLMKIANESGADMVLPNSQIVQVSDFLKVLFK